jgi:probable HAF family extracellular repeat protein
MGFRSALVLAALPALATRSAQADPLYTITNLGSVKAFGLNNAGEVVGDENVTGTLDQVSGYKPFVYQSYGPAAGTMTDLTNVFGGATLLQSINDSGQIVGFTLTGPIRGLELSGGQATPTLQASATSIVTATAINNAGAVIGEDGANGYISQNGHVTTLVGLDSPRAISSTGLVVGTGADEKAFVYQNGQTTYIAGNGSVAQGVNASGQVVGSYSPVGASFGSPHAFLYQNGRFTDLGTLGGSASVALAINSQGQIIGSSSLSSSQPNLSHAFLDQNGTMTDLTTLISPSSGWTLNSAIAINDKGQILGSGIGPDGQTDTFLLTPASEPPPVAPQVPEPTTLAFFGLVAAGAALRRAWRRSGAPQALTTPSPETRPGGREGIPPPPTWNDRFFES